MAVVTPGMEGIPLLWVQPTDKHGADEGRPFVCADGTRMAGPGQIIYWVASREAALSLDPWFVPVDDAIVEQVIEAIEHSDDLPTIPTVVVEVTNLLEDSSSSPGQLTEVVFAGAAIRISDQLTVVGAAVTPGTLSAISIARGSEPARSKPSAGGLGSCAGAGEGAGVPSAVEGGAESGSAAAVVSEQALHRQRRVSRPARPVAPRSRLVMGARIADPLRPPPRARR